MPNAHTSQQKEDRRTRRAKRREARELKRIQRVENIQQRLQDLRTRKAQKKRNLVFRIIRATLLLVAIIPLGVLAIASGKFSLLELPAELLLSEIKGTVEASEANDSAALALESVHTEASKMGMQSHSVMLADESLAEGGSLSVTGPNPSTTEHPTETDHSPA